MNQPVITISDGLVIVNDESFTMYTEFKNAPNLNDKNLEVIKTFMIKQLKRAHDESTTE